MAILRKAQNSGTSSQRIDMSGLDKTCWFLENFFEWLENGGNSGIA